MKDKFQIIFIINSDKGTKQKLKRYFIKSLSAYQLELHALGLCNFNLRICATKLKINIIIVLLYNSMYVASLRLHNVTYKSLTFLCNILALITYMNVSILKINRDNICAARLRFNFYMFFIKFKCYRY